MLQINLIVIQTNINSLLPVGRYINMDPYPTGLLISWTYSIWSGQFFFAESVLTSYNFPCYHNCRTFTKPIQLLKNNLSRHFMFQHCQLMRNHHTEQLQEGNSLHFILWILNIHGSNCKSCYVLGRAGRVLDTHKYNRVKYEMSKERVNSSGDPNMVQFMLTILNISEEDYGNNHSPCCILIVISNHFPVPTRAFSLF